MTCRCGSSPKCWNTIDVWLRRSSRSSDSLALVMSCPSITTSPAVGSISRVRQRTRVDLPDPDSPITTKTSPGATSNDTSLTPTTQSVFSLSSARDRSASGVPMISSDPLPKIFQRLRTDSAASPESVDAAAS